MATDGSKEQPPLIDVATAAVRLNLGISTLRRKIKAGDIPAYRVGGRGTVIRLDPRELDAWLRQPEDGA